MYYGEYRVQRLNLAKIKKLGANIVGVSRDKNEFHEKFTEKHGFKFPLTSDPEENSGSF